MTACEAMLFGRSTYQMFARLYQGGRVHPWASRLNAIPKYVVREPLLAAGYGAKPATNVIAERDAALFAI